MVKPRSKSIEYLVYLIVRALLAMIQAPPFPAACRFSNALAWLIYHLDRRHRLVAMENLRHAFPELDEQARDRMVRAVYRHFCLMLIELTRMPRKLHVSNWKRHLELVGGGKVINGLISSRPLLIVTGHFGNWEMAGFALGLFGFQTHAIAHTLDNPYLNHFMLVEFRQRTGQTILSKDGDFERISSVLASGGVIATLADQDAGQRGLYVDFFGRPASTHKAVALLSLEYSATMVVTGTPRVGGPLQYQTIVEDVIDPEEYRERPDAVRVMTERYTAALERLIRRFPEQYFWLHRRWKHQPKQKTLHAA